MKKRLLIVVGWLLLAGSVQANDLAPVALQSVTPDRSWFYNLEEVVFDADESYVPNGYIAWTKWYIDGVYQTQGSYYHNMSVCFALYGSPEGDCYELDQGKTTVQIKLMVQSNYGYWDEQTITYTIKEHKGRKYFVKDHLGSVRTTVNRDGNVLGYDDYYPFGLAMPGRSSNSANPNDDHKFTGHERDDEAGLTLDYMMARNYDPIIGRFLQIDPLADKFPGWSPYNYTFNNPLNFVDPTGMGPCDPPSSSDCSSSSNSSSSNPKSALYLLYRPVVALQIGGGFFKNSSSTSSTSKRFANGIATAGGGDRNALRHGIWQASIASGFGNKIAAEVGYAHEDNPDAIADGIGNMNSGFEDFDEADQFADLMNNTIAREIGNDNPNATFKDIVSSVLNVYKDSGFYTITENSDGNFVVQKTKLTEEQYKNAMDVLSRLDEDGKEQ